MNTGKIIADLGNKKVGRKPIWPTRATCQELWLESMNATKLFLPLKQQKKIVDALEVSLDYLVGEGINAHFEKKTVQRIQEIETLEPTVKDKLFFLIDTVIRDNKARRAYVI
jgi:hypothetical protein